MPVSAIPKKLVEISALPLSNSKARRLFILADGKRTIAQIFSLAKIGEQEGAEIINNMVDNGFLELAKTGTDRLPPPTGQSTSPSIKVPTKNFLDQISKELAKFIGPAAMIIVDDLDISANALGAEEQQQIIEALAQEIDDLNARKRFLAAVEI